MLDIQIFYCVIRITKFSGNCNACANSVPQALWPVSRLGVTIERILDDIRDSLMGEDVSREHLTNRRNIHNIRRVINLENIDKHKEDTISVHTWVSEMKEKETFNPDLLFNQQGKQDDHGTLEKDDFLLCMRTEFQLSMLTMFRNKAICMDATHGTTMHGLLLVTVLVIDEYGEGIPVAWALSNEEDQQVLTLFVYQHCSNL